MRITAARIEIDGNDVTVIGNTIQDCYIYGIIHFWGSNCSFLSNKIRNCCLTANYDAISFRADTQNFTCNDNVVIDDQTVATLRYPISVAPGTSDNYVIVGNNLTTRGTGTPVAILDQGGVAGDIHKVITNNGGVDDVLVTLVSAGTIVVPLNPVIILTGSATITSMAVGIVPQGARRTFLTDGAVVFTAGDTISNTVTCVAGEMTLATFNAFAAKWILK